MPRHAFKIISESGVIQPWWTLSEKAQIEDLFSGNESDFDDSESDYHIHQRWTYSPRYTVSFRMRISTTPDFALAANLVEHSRRGHKIAFQFDEQTGHTTTLNQDADIGDTTIIVNDVVKKNFYYRIIGEGGFRIDGPNVSLETEFPNYQSVQMFKVLDFNPNGTTVIDPPLRNKYLAGSRVSEKRYFESLLLTNDQFKMSYDQGKWFWFWDAEFISQRPDLLTEPAW